MDTKTRVVSLDITNWVNRGKTDAFEKITYNENTVEYGSVIYTEDLKIGEKLAMLLTPETASSSNEDEKASAADKIIHTTMPKEEKVQRFLARSDNFHAVVLYEEGTTLPYDEMDFEKHVPESFSGGISWNSLHGRMAVDYKEELGL